MMIVAHCQPNQFLYLTKIKRDLTACPLNQDGAQTGLEGCTDYTDSRELLANGFGLINYRQLLAHFPRLCT